MELRSYAFGDVHVLRLTGRFDNYVAPAVGDWLEKHISPTRSRLVVNMVDVHFVDSTALAILVQGFNRCRKYAGDLYLCNLQQQVYMIFELTRLDKAFHIFVDEAHAVSSFTG